MHTHSHTHTCVRTHAVTHTHTHTHSHSHTRTRTQYPTEAREPASLAARNPVSCWRVFECTCRLLLGIVGSVAMPPVPHHPYDLYADPVYVSRMVERFKHSVERSTGETSKAIMQHSMRHAAHGATHPPHAVHQ